MESSDSLTLDDTCEEEEEPTPTHIARFSQLSMIPISASEIFWSQIIPHALERRMDKNIYKDGKRCLIENTNDGALHYVHCLSRRLDPGRINDLEFAWGMRRGTLNLDTRFNVFCLSAKFKALWEEDKFILIPEDHILERYITAEEKFPDIGEGPYNYRLWPHPDMKYVPIHRQISFPAEAESPRADHFMFSAFPFKNLGILTSHIHPRFVICHIVARQLSSTNDILGNYSKTGQAARELIIQCMRIIAIWSPYVKDIASKDSDFLSSQIDPDDVYSETSDITANCRLRPHFSDKRLIEEQGYVYVKEEDGIIRLKHKEDAPHLLTAKKLRIFEEQIFARQIAKSQWEGIQSWRSTVSGEPEKQEQTNSSFHDAGHG